MNRNQNNPKLVNRSEGRMFVLALAALLVAGCGDDMSDIDTTPWSRSFGDAGEQYGMGTAVDREGNVLLTGYFEGTMGFGDEPMTSAGSYDAFVAKLDASGDHLWSHSFGDAGEQYAGRIAVDGAGDVLFTGYFDGTVDFGGGPLTSTGWYDTYVAKLDTGGTHQWSRRFGGNAFVFVHGITTDHGGNVLLSGVFAGAVDFGGGTLVSDGIDIFVAKLDASGDHLWSHSFGDGQGGVARSIAVDSRGNVLFTGNFLGTVDFGGGPLTSAGSYDTFVVKLDASGTHLWSQRFGGPGDDLGSGVAVDGEGNVLLTGFFQDTVDFGGGPRTSTELGEIFVVKLDASGAHQWSHGCGNYSDRFHRGIAVDDAGNVLLTGYFEGNVNFGGGSLASEGDIYAGDIYVAMLDASGAHLWSRAIGHAGGRQSGESITVDDAGNVLLTGHFEATVDFGDGPLPSAGGFDVFVTKLRTDL